MERFIRYVEIPANRNRVIRVLERVALVGAALVSALLLTAVYVRDYA